MRSDFDIIIPRRGSNSYKWDTTQSDRVLPMWVADMDFRTAPAVIEALHKRVEHGIFGYTKVPASYFDAIIGWFERRHNFTIEKKSILFTTGVVPALSAVIKALTQPGDKVIVQTPVYNCFFSSIRNDECVLIQNNLLYTNGQYTIDFDDLEEKASDPAAKLLLLCNPHNPVGRVWQKEELLRIGDICLRNDVIVVSDEIHCDLVYTGYKHIPFASLSPEFLQHSVTCIAPSKTFNLAGLQCANIVAADDDIRRKIDKALNVNEVCEINPFAIEALIAAYNEGEDWLEELKEYLNENYEFVKIFFANHFPDLCVLPLEATYLMWIDCTSYHLSSAEIAKRLLEEENVWVNEGTIYGEAGDGFIRLNIACPRATLKEGLKRIRKGFESISFT